MLSPRRVAPLIGLISFGLFLYFARSLSSRWHDGPEIIGLDDSVATTASSLSNDSYSGSIPSSDPAGQPYRASPNYVPGIPKQPGLAYTKTLVVPKMRDEDTSWLDIEIPEWQKVVYVADDLSAPLHPPRNKGHEVMVYLTYIIDHYENFSDIVAFMHSHQFSWHNEDLFDKDAAELLRRLNPARVVREGYMNLRCSWNPGCPDWIRPGTVEEDASKQEETLLARAWGEIFPDAPIPGILAQPCCAQFAVSRERILAIPKARFVYYRDWMFRTELTDYISGRIWEYLWHVVFTGENVVCPKENVCYCDGYGICFGGEEEYANFLAVRSDIMALEEELEQWRSDAQIIEEAQTLELLDGELNLPVLEPGKDIELQKQIDEKTFKFYELKDQAIERGKDPRLRAAEAGREWHEGDGF